MKRRTQICKRPTIPFTSSEIILGRRLPQRSYGIGFSRCFEQPAPEMATELIRYNGDGHLITVAPTRSGKGVGTVIPNLLCYYGSVVVVDPKAEAYAITARRRREMGQTVVCLDPFGVTGATSDSLNPLDIFQLTGADLESDAQALAEMLSSGSFSNKEPFWDIYGRALHSGVIAALPTDKPDERTMNQVVERLQNDDVVYNLAVFIDTMGKSMNEMGRREIAGVLSMPDVTRGGVLATAQSFIKALMSPAVQRTLVSSSFSLQDLVDGRPMSIYLVIPPDRMISHRPLLRLWIGTLMKAILSRRTQPELKTLLLIDEAAQLGNFPLLETLITLAAGYGVWVHTIWQDLSQLRGNFPQTWETILNNCAVVQTFGIQNRRMAEQWSEILDHAVAALRGLERDEQILSIHGQSEVLCKRLCYYDDPLFAGLFDQNHFFPAKKSRVLASLTS